MTNDPCRECYAHSGVEVCVQTCKREIEEVRSDVEGMKRFIAATLVSTVLSLIGIIAGFVMLWMKLPQLK